MKKNRRITIKIGGKDLGVNVPVNDEETYRIAAKEINKIVAAYQSSFEGQPDEFIYLAALHIAVAKVRMERDEKPVKQGEMLAEIDAKLDEYIRSTKIK